MSKVKPYCVFCGKKNNPLQKFASNTLNTSSYILSIRKENNLDSNNVILPQEVNDFQRYHSACYSKFTAVSKKYKVVPTKDKPSESTANVHLEDESVHDDNIAGPSTSKANVMDSHKSCADKDVPQSSDLDMDVDTESVEAQASKSSDEAVTSGAEKPKSKLQILQDVHKIAYDEVCTCVREDVIENKRCFFLDFYIRMYVDILENECNEYDREDLSIDLEADFELGKKLLKTFSKKIDIVILKKKKVIKPYGVSSKSIDFDELEKQDILQRAGLILRQEINEIERQPLPADQLNANDLIKGECVLPPMLTHFFETLLGGLNVDDQEDSTDIKKTSESLSSDLVYAVTDGKVKPSKHITLGLAAKWLTNSEAAVNILNEYRHCCDNIVLEELETKVMSASSDQLGVCPEGILRKPNLGTGVAFKRVDCSVDTPSGEDKLHSLAGIIYQNIDDTAQNKSEVEENIVADMQPEESSHDDQKLTPKNHD